MESKPWYASKIMWTNLIAVIALIIQGQFGFIIDAEAQLGILAVINIVLRAITNTSLTVSAPQSDNAGQGGYASVVTLIAMFLVAAAVLTLSGCVKPSTTTPTPNDSPMILAGKSLLTVKTTINTAASAVDALCKAEKIGRDKCLQAKDAWLMAQPAYDSAVDAYLLMSQGGDPAEFGRSLQRVQSIATTLLKFTGGAP